MNERLETRKRRRSVSFLGVCEGIEKLFSNKNHCLHRLELSFLDFWFHGHNFFIKKIILEKRERERESQR